MRGPHPHRVEQAGGHLPGGAAGALGRGVHRGVRRRLPGGYLSARYGHKPPEAALALAVACGAASTQRVGAGVLDPSDVEALRRRVEVSEIG